MKNILRFLSIGCLSATVAPVTSACYKTSALTEFKEELKDKLEKTDFIVYDYYKTSTLTKKTRDIVMKLNEEKYNFKIEEVNIALVSDSEFNLHFSFYKVDEKNPFSAVSEIEFFSIVLPFIVE